MALPAVGIKTTPYQSAQYGSLPIKSGPARTLKANLPHPGSANKTNDRVAARTMPTRLSLNDVEGKTMRTTNAGGGGMFKGGAGSRSQISQPVGGKTATLASTGRNNTGGVIAQYK